MAVSAATLLVEVAADVGTTVRDLETVGAKVTTMGNLSKVANYAFVGAFAGIGIAAFDTAVKFEQATNTIRKGTGATGSELEGLGESMRNVFTQTPASIDDVSTAIATLNTRTGATGEQLENLSLTMLRLSRMSGAELAPMIESTTRLFGDWGIAAGQQIPTLDKLWRASQATGVGVDQLAQQMTVAGAQFRLLGFDFDTTAALLGKFEKEGVNADQVVSTLRMGLAKMAKEGFTDLPSAFGEITRRIKEATTETDALNIANEYFGARAGVQMAAAVREGRFELGELLNVIGGGSETIAKAGSDTSTFAGKWEILKHKLMEAIEPIGKKLVDSLDRLMKILLPIVDFLAPFADKLAIAGLAAFSIAKGIKIVNAGMKMFQTISTAMTMTNPWLLVLGAIAAAAYLIITNWDKVWPVIKKVGQWFADVFGKIWDVLGPILEKVVEFGKKIILGIWDGMKWVWDKFWWWNVTLPLKILDALWQGLQKLWDLGKAAFSWLWDGIRWVWDQLWHWLVERPAQVLQMLFDGFGRLWDAGMHLIQSIWNGIVAAWNWFIGQVARIGGWIWDTIWGGLRNIWQIGVDLLHGLWDGIVSVKDWIIDKIKGLGRSIINGFKSIFGISSPSKVFAAFGGNMMQGLADGISGGAQLPADALARVSRGLSADATLGFSTGSIGAGGVGTFGGGAPTGPVVPQVTIIVQGSIVDKDGLAKATDDALARLGRRSSGLQVAGVL